jgi:hypothetical protein
LDLAAFKIVALVVKIPIPKMKMAERIIGKIPTPMW